MTNHFKSNIWIFMCAAVIFWYFNLTFWYEHLNKCFKSFCKLFITILRNVVAQIVLFLYTFTNDFLLLSKCWSFILVSFYFIKFVYTVFTLSWVSLYSYWDLILVVHFKFWTKRWMVAGLTRNESLPSLGRSLRHVFLWSNHSPEINYSCFEFF